jgi:hypothetical protein
MKVDNKILIFFNSFLGVNVAFFDLSINLVVGNLGDVLIE